MLPLAAQMNAKGKSSGTSLWRGCHSQHRVQFWEGNNEYFCLSATQIFIAAELKEDSFSTELCAQYFVNNPATTSPAFLSCTEPPPPTEIREGPSQVPGLAAHQLCRSLHLQASTIFKLPAVHPQNPWAPIHTASSPSQVPHDQFIRKQKKQQCPQHRHTVTDVPEEWVILVLLMKPCLPKANRWSLFISRNKFSGIWVILSVSLKVASRQKQF